jgi:hypothetical protein
MQVNLSNRRRNQILVGLLLALGLPLLPLGAWGERLNAFGPLVGHESLWWIAVAVLLFYVLRVERRPLTSDWTPQARILGRSNCDHWRNPNVYRREGDLF